LVAHIFSLPQKQQVEEGKGVKSPNPTQEDRMDRDYLSKIDLRPTVTLQTRRRRHPPDPPLLLATYNTPSFHYRLFLVL
jgi:hypothetical protein